MPLTYPHLIKTITIQFNDDTGHIFVEYWGTILSTQSSMVVKFVGGMRMTPA